MFSIHQINNPTNKDAHSIIIYRDKISTIEYDKKRHNITYYEHGFANKELLIAQLRAVIDFSKTHPIYSIITDFRKLQGSFKNIFTYLKEDYYPALKSQGLKSKAFIVSEDIISNHLTNELVKDLKKTGIHAAVFSTTKAAGNWVRQCKEAS